MSKDDSHKVYPQVNRETALSVNKYLVDVRVLHDRIFLSTTSKNYGEASPSQIEGLTKSELEEFIKQSIACATFDILLDRLHRAAEKCIKMPRTFSLNMSEIVLPKGKHHNQLLKKQFINFIK